MTHHPANRAMTTSLALVLFLTTGCGARAPEFTAQSWQLDRLRILGVRSEPAEPVPGDAVQFERLAFAPPGSEILLWVWCIPRGPNQVECELDEALEQELLETDLDALSQEELDDLLARGREAGLIGLEPVTEPAMMVPPTLLDQLDPEQTDEGTNVLVQLWALTPDPRDVEIAVKRIPVSLAATPNHNPDLDAWLVDGEEVGAGEAVQVDPGAEVVLEPVLAGDAIESYEYVNDSGDVEERLEEPYYSWYLEDGTFDRYESLASDGAVTWTAPDGAFEGLVVCVVRDRRGGMGWIQLDVAVD